MGPASAPSGPCSGAARPRLLGTPPSPRHLVRGRKGSHGFVLGCALLDCLYSLVVSAPAPVSARSDQRAVGEDTRSQSAAAGPSARAARRCGSREPVSRQGLPLGPQCRELLETGHSSDGGAVGLVF